MVKHQFKVFLFVGANQAKIPFDLTVAMQQLGRQYTVLKISGNGLNTLYFHIAYYIGELARQDKKPCLHII